MSAVTVEVDPEVGDIVHLPKAGPSFALVLQDCTGYSAHEVTSPLEWLKYNLKG